jgi:serine/threonine protein phosphatase PrpC
MKGMIWIYLGWREYMEDASININNFPIKNHYLFGVFDGHGGICFDYAGG